MLRTGLSPPEEEEEEEEAVFIRGVRRRRWRWWSELVKIEGDPLNTQHAGGGSDAGNVRMVS